MYLREYISTCEAYGWNGGPEFSTRIVPLLNGRENRNADWQQYRNRYTLPFQNIDASGYANIRQMFEVCRGQLHCFLYSDPLARAAVNQLFATGDGVTDTFQLTTLSVLDGVSYQRGVYAIPDAGVVTVTVNGTPTSAFTIDRDRGLIVFDTPPANDALLRWTGPFDIWVRFNNDWLPFSIDNRSGAEYVHNGTIDLIEVAPPELVGS